MKEYLEIIAEIETVLRITGEESEAIQALIKETSETTGRRAADIAAEILRMALTGRELDDILAVLEGA